MCVCVRRVGIILQQSIRASTVLSQQLSIPVSVSLHFLISLYILLETACILEEQNRHDIMYEERGTPLHTHCFSLFISLSNSTSS